MKRSLVSDTAASITGKNCPTITRIIERLIPPQDDLNSGCEWLKYVRHNQIFLHQKAGWSIVNDLSDCNHGVFSVLMKYDKLSKLI